MSRRCGCSGSTCSCVITGRGGIKVTGGGSASNPYVVEGGASLLALDSDTVNLSLNGDGSSANPWSLRADATIDMADIVDFDDSNAATGNVISRRADGSYGLAPPSTTAPGAVNVGDGLQGDGSSGAPLSVKLKSGSGLILDTNGLAAVSRTVVSAAELDSKYSSEPVGTLVMQADGSKLYTRVVGGWKIIGQDIGSLRSEFLMPEPIVKAFPASSYLIPSTATAGTTVSRVPETLISLVNAGTNNLVVRIVQEGWGLLHGDASDNTVAMYAEPETSGGTYVFGFQARMESPNPAGAPKNVQAYRDMFAESVRIAKPGETINARARVWTTSIPTNRAGWNPQFRYGSIAIIPAGFSRSPGSAWDEPDYTDTLPPDVL